MKASNNPALTQQALTHHVRRHHVVIVVVWVISTLIAASYFINARLVEFDPNGKLQQNRQGFVMSLLAQAQLDPLAMDNTIIHFTSEGCVCNSYSQAHKQTLNQQAISNGYQVINLTMTAALRELVPATPAALVMSNEGKLVYFGPYSEGLACSSSNSLIELAINNFNKGFNPELIIDKAKGCYCQA
ncbi:DUF6436 domain-containing protein [Motilimonas cestriensis]|uniref:DUF6436 domain-containing protein n=1 Tax=Motilimonas cestriensis TaxID=2742685 RepID=A0ABS8WBH5_9GAMM|nr:DUF6436 domain-containing protein [Motilimonas cestriensis]MCE2596369.1 DUF6436 domain-containing protein [Motilimonas cestriensis]